MDRRHSATRTPAGIDAADALMAVFGLTRAPDPDRGPLPPGGPREDDGGEDCGGSDAPEWVGSDREGRG